MPTIHRLNIKNFRGIKSFEQIFSSDFVCLIGRGDVGKSTILEAISHVLSPNWNITYYDNDFYNCDLNNTIEIEAIIKDLPATLITEEKFGGYINGLNTDTNKIEEELEDNHEKVLTIRLEVDKDLEPKWSVVCDRHDPKPISATDRGKLNMFMTADSVDRHFSWSKGSPLYTLFKDVEGTTSIEENLILDVLRTAKTSIDGSFSKLDATTQVIKGVASIMGLELNNANTTIDFRDIAIRDSKVCLHDGKIPLRLKGKGSRRLASIAIQTAIAASGGIILIDEIEQGLEPDRVQNLVSILKMQNEGQIFITTHSRDVIVELETKDLYLLSTNGSKLTPIASDLQGVIRANPECMFANKILVCEGETEIGVCKALNNFRISTGKKNAAHLGVRFAKGVGSAFIKYSKSFKALGFPTAVFCDSDDAGINAEKSELTRLGITIFDWEIGDCLEVALFKSASVDLVKKMLDLAAQIIGEENNISANTAFEQQIKTSISSKTGNSFPQLLSNEVLTNEMRIAIGVSASKKNWFKRISKGERLGNLLFANQSELGPAVIQMFSRLEEWIDNGS